MQKSLVLLIIACFVFGSTAHAQTMLVNTPNPSPKASVEQFVGLTKVRIDFYRPAVKDRTVWGELVPYGTPWRAGANDNTTIKFTSDVKINGEDLAAGVYGLHLIVNEKDATLIFSNNATSWGSYSYQASEDALRVNIKSQAADGYQEYMNFTFGAFTGSAAECALQWENRKFPFTISTEVHEEVLAGMRKDLRNKAGWTWQGWNEAANYCLQNNVNVAEGLGWAQRSVFMSPNINNMITKAKLVSLSENLNDDDALDRQLAALEDDLSKMPVTWKEFHGAAKYAQNNERNEQALMWTDKSIEMSPTMTNMMTKKEILVAQGETKKAEKVKTEALSKGTNAELNIYAYGLMWAGKTAEAVEIFEANANKYPEDPNVWDSLGEGYINNGQNEKAVTALRKSLSLNPPANIKANSMRLLTTIGVDPESINP